MRTPEFRGPSVAVLLLLIGGCAGSPEPAAPPLPSAGHQRMLDLLDLTAADSRGDNAFFGRNQVAELEQALAQLPPDVPDLRRWFFNQELARHELRLGNGDRAIDYAMAAYDQLDLFADEIPEERQLKTILQVAVVYMRRAEEDNCLAHHTSESCLFPIRGGGIHVDKEPSRQAVRYLREVLERAEPGSWWYVKAQWLFNIVSMTLGEYPDGVPEIYLIAPETFDSEIPFPRFPETAAELGLATVDLSGSVAAEDFDGDGWIDLLTSSADTDRSLQLFWNDGRGGFTEGAAAAGLDGLRGGLNLTQADYDNDGDADVLVLRGAWWRLHGRHPNSLLRNNGDRTFSDVTFESGLGEVHWPTQAAAWADYDNDGDLDLYVGNESGGKLDAPGQLFRNDGAEGFTDVAVAAGVTNDRFAKAVAWGDYDRDRLPDLFVSNMGGRNRLYHNNGDGSFTDVAAAAGVEGPIASFASWFWDYDNDGHLDLFVSGYGGVGLGPDIGFVAASYFGVPTQAETAALYRGDGSGGFTDTALSSGLERITHPMGANHGDLDNDGYPDFYLGTGYPYYEALMPNVMYNNLQGRRFADVTTAGGFGHLQKGHGIAFADLDNDGDQDVFAQMGGMYPGDAFGNALFENPGFGRHWIRIALDGRRSNRSGVGARIRLVIREEGTEREIHRLVGTGGSFGSNPLGQQIGVGTAESIARLEVYWPTSDSTQLFENVAADRTIVITEGESQLYSPGEGRKP